MMGKKCGFHSNTKDCQISTTSVVVSLMMTGIVIFGLRANGP